MDINDLTKDLELLKRKAPDAYNDIVYFGVPFYMFHSKFFEGANKILKDEYNLTRSEIDILSSLFFSGGENCTLTPTALMGRLLFSWGGVTKILKKLEEKGFVQRLENKDDKRSKFVKLHEKGKEIVPLALKSVFSYEESCLKNLDENEKDLLSSLLRKALQ